MEAGKYLVASLRWAGTSPWYGGTFYVNLLTPGVTEKFLELTMELGVNTLDYGLFEPFVLRQTVTE